MGYWKMMKKESILFEVLNNVGFWFCILTMLSSVSLMAFVIWYFELFQLAILLVIALFVIIYFTISYAEYRGWNDKNIVKR